MNGGNVERGEDAGTVEEGIDFLTEGDLGGGREDVIDEGEGRIESCLWRGWGCVPTQRVNEENRVRGGDVLEFNIVVLAWGHDDATCEELMSETEYGPYRRDSSGCDECRRGTKRDRYYNTVNHSNQEGVYGEIIRIISLTPSALAGKKYDLKI